MKYETVKLPSTGKLPRDRGKMKRLKEQGKEKSATYRQLMGNKMQYQNMLAMYRIYGLLDEELMEVDVE